MTALTLVSLFVFAAGFWLGLMENILKHDGYAERSAIAVCILVQAAATLLFTRRKSDSEFRYFVLPGAVAFLILGGASVFRILQAKHFEGFALIIGLALLLQGALTLATSVPRRARAIRSR